MTTTTAAAFVHPGSGQIIMAVVLVLHSPLASPPCPSIVSTAPYLIKYHISYWTRLRGRNNGRCDGMTNFSTMDATSLFSVSRILLQKFAHVLLPPNKTQPPTATPSIHPMGWGRARNIRSCCCTIVFLTPHNSWSVPYSVVEL